MVRYSVVACVLCVSFASAAWNASAETFALQDKSCQRELRVVRRYEIVVQQGKPSVAALPALMSFWGETNWQLVKSSRFTYSEQPDKTEITSDDRGQPRRYYRMTWNAPKANKIAVEQTLDVALAWFGTLYTSAKLPYDDGVLKRFSTSLGADKKEGINPDNPDLGPICDPIVKRSRSAEEVVEGVCDWINENVKFVKGQRTSDEALAQRQGSCTPMSRLACSMLRRIGIPAEMVDAKFIGSENGHTFIEAYFPDAGWIFYDLSNWNRGYKSLDCLMTVGWAYRSGTPESMAWTEGHFCVEKDTTPYPDRPDMASRLIRKSPQGKRICSVTVVAQKPPPSAKPRQRPLKELILDTAIPPGQREYSDNALESPETATKPGLSGK